jgi:hypothetical protein
MVATKLAWFGGLAALSGFVITLAAGAPGATLATGNETAIAAPAATPASCPVTHPNGKQPPAGEHVFGRGPGGHGNDALWTNLWTWGEGAIHVPPAHVQPDGSLGGMKWPWWRGVPGRLTIEGERLDADAPPLQADIPEGYGDVGFQVSGLIFPTAGCWQVTGRVGGSSLTFVVNVVPVSATGTPVASA